LREGRALAGAVAIRTDTDRSLGYLPEEREAPDNGLWALEISGLVRFLEGQLALLPPGTRAAQFQIRGGPRVHADVDFVERLMRTWDCGSERGQPRLSAGHHLDTVIGMHDLHFALAGGIDFDTFLRKTRGLAISLHESDRVASWAAGPAGAPPRVKQISAKVVDQSLGGYRLVWEKIDGMRLKVGELLGLAPVADAGEAQDWMIGAVRWLRIEPSGAMDAGVELLARRAVPVALRSFDPEGVPRAAMRGVLLETLDGTAAAMATSIIAPQMFDRESAEIELTRPGDPFGWPVETTVEIHKDPQVSDRGAGYLHLVLAADASAGIGGSVAHAANDDLPPPLGNPALQQH
jgi:hypothetical protein